MTLILSKAQKEDRMIEELNRRAKRLRLMAVFGTASQIQTCLKEAEAIEEKADFIASAS